MDAVLTLERLELLYDADVLAESERDQRAIDGATGGETAESGGTNIGIPMISDHRRVLATALGRIRGKLAYRPVVFELLPGEFTLLHLQQVAEALSGTHLHKQNFRRLVMNADLVEAIGRTTAIGRGRPAEPRRLRAAARIPVVRHPHRPGHKTLARNRFSRPRLHGRRGPKRAGGGDVALGEWVATRTDFMLE